MTYIDYINWAQEYREQAELIDKKLAERIKRRTFTTPEERSEYERGTQMLYDMRRECRFTCDLLARRAESIREAE